MNTVSVDLDVTTTGKLSIEYVNAAIVKLTKMGVPPYARIKFSTFRGQATAKWHS